jgi:hypothetical protein
MAFFALWHCIIKVYVWKIFMFFFVWTIIFFVL